MPVKLSRKLKRRSMRAKMVNPSRISLITGIIFRLGKVLQEWPFQQKAESQNGITDV